MVDITINAPQRSMEDHRLLSERIVRAVAETYQCEDAEIILAILVKPPGRTDECRPGTVLCRNPLRPEGTDCCPPRVTTSAPASPAGPTFNRRTGRPLPRRYLRGREAYAAVP